MARAEPASQSSELQASRDGPTHAGREKITFRPLQVPRSWEGAWLHRGLENTEVEASVRPVCGGRPQSPKRCDRPSRTSVERGPVLIQLPSALVQFDDGWGTSKW